MDKVQYKVEQCGEYYGLPAINVTLERVLMEDDDPLWERTNDARTPFEQYDAGEEYIYVDLSDLIENSKPAIYSRGAYHHTFLKHGLPYYTCRNFKIDFDGYVRTMKRCTEMDEQAKAELLEYIETNTDYCEPYGKEGLVWGGFKNEDFRDD